MNTRVPYDPNYTTLVGTAVYVFAYYEWAIIYLIQQFKPGFVARYCRSKPPMTSGVVKNELGEILADPQSHYPIVTKSELQECYDEFVRLINKRNALIHAHPITYHDGSQILNYQTSVDRPLPDMKWPVDEVRECHPRIRCSSMFNQCITSAFPAQQRCLTPLKRTLSSRLYFPTCYSAFL